MSAVAPRVAAFGLCLGLLAPPGQAFERLFTTPQERAAIDARRFSGDAAALEMSGAEGGMERRIEVLGLLRRSSNAGAVWTRDRMHPASTSSKSRWRLVKGREVPAVELRLDADRALRLKPGQALLLDEGRLVERFAIRGGSAGAASSPPTGE